MPNIQAVEIGRGFFFCVKGAPAVQVTAPTAFNIGRFCFVLQIWGTYMIKYEKNISGT